LGFENHGSFRARWEGIVSCWKIFLEYPLFGIGVGGVGPYLYKKNSLYDNALITLTDVETYDPTNVLPEVLASLGLMGFIGVIILACVFYRAFKKVITNSTISSSEKNISTALFISLIMLLIVLQINQGLFRPYIWIHAGIVYGYLNSRRLATVDEPIYQIF
jgi:O-antigen ligase